MRSVVLNFHGIGEPQRELEHGEASYWVSAAFFSDVLTLIQSVAGEVDVAVTFDDGNRSDLEIAAPALHRAGLRSETFVLAGRLDQPGSLGREDLHALQELGMEIGLHGFDHIDWKCADALTLQRELREARALLEEAADCSIDKVAVPFGSYNGAVVAALRRAGFTCIYTSDGGARSVNALIQPRTSLTDAMTIESVRQILLGEEPFLTSLRRRAAMTVKRLI